MQVSQLRVEVLSSIVSPVAGHCHSLLRQWHTYHMGFQTGIQGFPYYQGLILPRSHQASDWMPSPMPTSYLNYHLIFCRSFQKPTLLARLNHHLHRPQDYPPEPRSPSGQSYAQPCFFQPASSCRCYCHALKCDTWHNLMYGIFLFLKNNKIGLLKEKWNLTFCLCFPKNFLFPPFLQSELPENAIYKPGKTTRK